jgi:two-component system, LytTR family, response regulator
MTRAIIIDDEEGSRETLNNLVSDFLPDVEVVALAYSVETGKEAIKKFKPDLVFLDIQMQNETGFDLLETFREINFEIIFTTAYDHFAVKAFKFSALDYLLKPIDIEELKTAVEKAKKKRSYSNSSLQLNALLHNQKSLNNNFKKIALPTLEGLEFIQINNIIRFEADGAYTMIFLVTGEKMVVSKIIKEFEDMLSENHFFRPHQSHLINLHHMKKYVKGDGGYAVMSDNSNIPIARRKKDEFLKALSEL